MKVLVIFSLVPEEEFRCIVDMTDAEYSFFSKAHNVFIGLDDDESGVESALVIMNAFADTKSRAGYCDTDKQREYFGKWKSDLDVTDISAASKIICTGIIT